MHNQFLNIDWWKVSKSKWDDLSIPWIVSKWFDALDLRYFYLTWHYRNFLDFSRDALENAKKTRHNLAKKIVKSLSESDLDDLNVYVPLDLYNRCCEALADDLDTVKVLTLLHSHVQSSCENAIDALLLDVRILKVWLFDLVREHVKQSAFKVPDTIIKLAEERTIAKSEKNFQKADELRSKINESWRTIKDWVWGYELFPR